MTVIQCDIRDSLGNPITGFIRVTLDYWLPDGAQSYLEVPAQVPITAGLTTLDLEPSELAKVTYLFEIYRTGTPDVLLRSFRALVPDNLTPINLNDLAQQTGITRDAQATAIGAITRRLFVDPDFWLAARTNIFPQKGTYSPTAFYKSGDVVLYNGSTYVCTSIPTITNIVPTNTSVWQLWASQGATGTGTAGNDLAYDPVAWDGATDAPSRNAIRDLVQNTLATQSALAAKADRFDGLLDRPLLGDRLLTPTDNSNKIPDTAWVQALVQTIARAQTPIGSIIAFAGSAAPTGWIICDGRAISRATFSQLFAIIGVVYGVGDGSSTFNLPDLRGRVIVAPDSSALQGAANRIPAAGLGTTGGSNQVVLSSNQLPAHNHPAIGSSAGYWTQVPSGGNSSVSFGVGATSVLNPTTANNATNNDPVNLLQPYQVINHIIYSGVV